MGECVYYLKAKFPEEKRAKAALKEIGALQEEGEEVDDFIESNETESKEFWPGFEKKFPHISAYLKSINLFGSKEKGDLEGVLNFGNPENDAPYLDGEGTLCLSAYVWHFAKWSPIADYLVKAFGATKTAVDTEEDGCGSMDNLQFYDYQEIVESILNHKDVLPLLLHINSDLDELIDERLRSRK